MSRTSPGRYALHEFAKNVYAVSAEDGTGRAAGNRAAESAPVEHRRSRRHGPFPLHALRRPQRRHLCGDRCESRPSQRSGELRLGARSRGSTGRGADRHARELAGGDTAVRRRRDGKWTAPNLAYFIDSPIEVSAAERFSWTIGEGESEQTIELALHHTGEAPEAQALADVSKLIVDEQIAIFGEPPVFDDGRYTFLVDALPWSNGDGMEHRNSTIVATGAR